MTLKEKFAEFTKQESWEKENYNAKECEQIVDDYAIEFGCFLRKECLIDDNYIYWWYNGAKYTEKELLEIFKKEKLL